VQRLLEGELVAWRLGVVLLPGDFIAEDFRITLASSASLRKAECLPAAPRIYRAICITKMNTLKIT
jgi:hypothetical protein